MKKGQFILISITIAFLGLVVGLFIGRNTIRTVPTKAPNKSVSSQTDVPALQNGRFDINTATISQLQELPGIGEITAQSIIDYRNEHGPFQQIEDLLNVKGIGETRFNEIKDYICVLE